MGLDMYLKATKYVSGWEFSDTEDKADYSKLLELFGLQRCDESPGAEVSITIAYWRKANHIHKWFVDNCQDGDDRCQESYVSREQLQELLGICKQVLSQEKVASDLLPTASGFFFGSTDYDEYYLRDTQNTVDMLESILSNESLESFDFKYHASW